LCVYESPLTEPYFHGTKVYILSVILDIIKKTLISFLDMLLLFHTNFILGKFRSFCTAKGYQNSEVVSSMQTTEL